MNYWLTVHWPLREGYENVEWKYWVFVPKGREQTAKEMQQGDLIFIYETKTGRQLKRQKYDYHEGRQGIIALVKAVSQLEPTNEKPEEYADGTKIWWFWQARTELIKECFIPRKDVCRVLGYSTNYNFRGFGDYQSGLKKLTVNQFSNLHSKC